VDELNLAVPAQKLKTVNYPESLKIFPANRHSVGRADQQEATPDCDNINFGHAVKRRSVLVIHEKISVPKSH